MMNGGWPTPSSEMMCCKTMMMNGGGWPEEEEPDYYEEEEEMGWDTNNDPNYALPNSGTNKNLKKTKEHLDVSAVRRGDDIEDISKNKMKSNTKTIFRKGLKKPWNNYELDFDYY